MILKLTLELDADMVLTGRSNVTPLKVLVVDAAIVVLPVIYTLLPSLAEMTIFSLMDANEAGLRALFRVMVLELLVAVEYKEENTNI